MACAGCRDGCPVGRDVGMEQNTRAFSPVLTFLLPPCACQFCSSEAGWCSMCKVQKFTANARRKVGASPALLPPPMAKLPLNHSYSLFAFCFLGWILVILEAQQAAKPGVGIPGAVWIWKNHLIASTKLPTSSCRHLPTSPAEDRQLVFLFRELCWKKPPVKANLAGETGGFVRLHRLLLSPSPFIWTPHTLIALSPLCLVSLLHVPIMLLGQFQTCSLHRFLLNAMCSSTLCPPSKEAMAQHPLAKLSHPGMGTAVAGRRSRSSLRGQQGWNIGQGEPPASSTQQGVAMHRENSRSQTTQLSALLTVEFPSFISNSIISSVPQSTVGCWNLFLPCRKAAGFIHRRWLTFPMPPAQGTEQDLGSGSH